MHDVGNQVTFTMRDVVFDMLGDRMTLTSPMRTDPGQAPPTASVSITGGNLQFCKSEYYDTVLRGIACK